MATVATTLGLLWPLVATGWMVCKCPSLKAFWMAWSQGVAKMATSRGHTFCIVISVFRFILSMKTRPIYEHFFTYIEGNPIGERKKYSIGGKLIWWPFGPQKGLKSSCGAAFLCGHSSKRVVATM